MSNEAERGPPTLGERITSSIKAPIVYDGTRTRTKTILFFIICAAWLLPGLIGHDPWKTDEATHFGIIHSLLSGGSWLVPTLVGEPHVDYPPLYFWVAALFANMLSPLLALHDGARLSSGFFLVVTMTFTGLTAIRLIDDRAGRIAVLLMIGCLGLLQRGHEINPELAGMAGTAIALYGMTRIRSDALRGAALTASGGAIIALSVGAIPAAGIIFILLALGCWVHEWSNRIFVRGVVLATLLITLASVLWPLMLLASDTVLSTQQWLGAASGSYLFDAHQRNSVEPFYFLRILPWYAFPALPIAIWAWAKNRRELRSRIELALPLVAFFVLLVMVTMFRTPRDSSALSLLVPLAIAAAYGLDRVSRNLASFLDWFGLMFFGLLVLFIWAVWAGSLTGIPRNAARWVAREAPGYELHFVWWAFIVALLLTVIWIFGVVKIHRTNRRAIINWCAGITLVWVLINLFALPAIDHARSYRAMSHEISVALKEDKNCKAQLNLGDPQRASLYYFAGLKFEPAASFENAPCQTLLVQGNQDAPPVNAMWTLIWNGSRAGDKTEHFWLYRKANDPI